MDHEDPTIFRGALDALQNALDGCVACDANFRIVFLNSAAEELYGKAKSEILGTILWESSDWGSEAWEPLCRRVLAGRAAESFGTYHQSLGRWLEVRVSPAEWSGLCVWSRDVTEHKISAQKLRESRAILDQHLAEIESIYADAPVGLAALDSELRHVRINKLLAQMNGLPVAAHQGRTLREVVPELAPIMEPLLRRVLETGAPVTHVQTRNGAAPSGYRGDWLVSLSPLKTSGTEVIGVNVVIHDISEPKRLERALKKSTGELREAQRLAGVGSWSWDLASDTLTWSEEVARLPGLNAPMLATDFQGMEQYCTPVSWRRVKAAAMETCADGALREIEVESVAPDGQHYWRIVRGEGQRDPSGKIISLHGTVQDVTERKRVEENLRAAHAELAAIHANAPIVFLVVDEDLRVRKVNEAALRFAARPERELLGFRPGDTIGCMERLTDPRGCGFGAACHECPFRGAILDSLRNQQRHDNVEAWATVRGSGGLIERRCFLLFTAPLQISGAKQALVCALDITARKRAEKALRDSEFWLKESQRISRVGTCVLDCATGTWTSSETLDEIFGIGPDYNRTLEGWETLVHPQHREEIKSHLEDDVLREHKPFDHEYRIVRPCDGQVRWVHGRGGLIFDSAGVPTAMTGTIQDITARRAVEEDLRQAQKLEGLGRLAGGIAHDFNNLLTVINGYADMLLRELKSRDSLREPVAEIRTAGEQAAKLTGQLLAFSRKQIIRPQALNLNRLIEENLTMFRRLMGEDVEVETRLEPQLGSVVADPGQIHQVLLNLVANARDAMPRGGKLRISTSHADVTDPGGIPPGRYVVLSVADSGIGIAPEAHEHIFDPFYTTKGKGAGTGLGLATVYGIVQQANGSISFQSEPGRGTTFTIHLPRTDTAAAEEREPAGSSAGLRGTQTVLVVEDQESVRKLAVLVLRKYGYKVLEASGGDEALRMVQDYAQPVHVLLTDAVMPRMTGKELVEHLLRIRPGIKVLFMSGYAEDVIANRGLLAPGLLCISKPFAPEALARKVRQALRG